jgi:hypothetical protein
MFTHSVWTSARRQELVSSNQVAADPAEAGPADPEEGPAGPAEPPPASYTLRASQRAVVARSLGLLAKLAAGGLVVEPADQLEIAQLLKADIEALLLLQPVKEEEEAEEPADRWRGEFVVVSSFRLWEQGGGLTFRPIMLYIVAFAPCS